jgi:hypothetical protein
LGAPESERASERESGRAGIGCQVSGVRRGPTPPAPFPGWERGAGLGRGGDLLPGALIRAPSRSLSRSSTALSRSPKALAGEGGG